MPVRRIPMVIGQTTTKVTYLQQQQIQQQQIQMQQQQQQPQPYRPNMSMIGRLMGTRPGCSACGK